MEVFIPISVYRLPGDESWTADAIGLEGAVAEGGTALEAKGNLAAVLKQYVSMLNLKDPIQAAEIEYLERLTAPPEGTDWIVVPKAAPTTDDMDSLLPSDGTKRRSNPEVGMEFAEMVRVILEHLLGIKFDREVSLSIGDTNHPFDLVSVNRDWYVECKKLEWRRNPDYIPRNKITSITRDAELLRSLETKGHKAIILSRAQHPVKGETLAEYYVRLYGNRLGRVMLGEVDVKARTLRWLTKNARL